MKPGATWITQIRQMEATGQTMGLDETLDSDGLTATEENGIDVHMMLPTEYGAVAILSASGYGNRGKLQDEPDEQKRTTTGNTTGIYYTCIGYEALAGTDAIGENKYVQGDTTFKSVLSNFSGWHDSLSTEFHCGDRGNNANPMLVIAGNASIFTMHRIWSARINKGDSVHAWSGQEIGDAYDRPRAQYVVWKGRGVAIPIM